MTTRYGLYGERSRQLLTYGGQVITHHNRAQMEWLHPGTRVVEVPADVPAAQCLPLIAHPDYASVRFDPITGDLDKEQFRDPR